MRLIFAGTPAVAVPTLRALNEIHEVVAVVTRPDAPLGRKRTLTPSAVALAAGELGIDTVKTAKLDATVTEQLMAMNADLGVIVAFGGLVREPLLSAPAKGWINLHFSLLPRWRGAAPVQRALIAGDQVLGATVFQLVPELDAGDVYAARAVNVPNSATAGEALELLAVAGAQLTAEVVDDIAAEKAVAAAQIGEVTLAPKLSLEDGHLDFTASGDAVYARFRGVTPEPGAFTTVGDARVKILEASLANDASALGVGEVRADGKAILIGTATAPLRVSRVQPAGRGPMSAADWLRGQRDEVRAGT